MSDLVGNPEDRFSRVEAQMMFVVFWSIFVTFTQKIVVESLLMKIFHMKLS